MKLRVVYDPVADVPACVEVAPANVNDVEIGCEVPIAAGATYVFDKGYCRRNNSNGSWRPGPDPGGGCHEFTILESHKNCKPSRRFRGTRNYEPLIGSDSRKSMTDIEDCSGAASPELERIP